MSAPTPYATCSRLRARLRACGKRSSTSAWTPTSVEDAPTAVNTPASANTIQAPVNPWSTSPAAISAAADGRTRWAPKRRMKRPPKRAPRP